MALIYSCIVLSSVIYIVRLMMLNKPVLEKVRVRNVPGLKFKR
jgi:hypothetical protein